jgi:hypothetical protein
LTATGIITGIGSGLTTLNGTNISSGTLAVARGGTGATEKTGTGNNVLSASPTLTGTVLCSDNVSGALGPVVHIKNFGAGGGAASALDFSTYELSSLALPGARIMALDDANYSAHLTFSTKTPGEDLNAHTERIRITSAGNVGIGTNVPSTALHVNGVITGNGSGLTTLNAANISSGILPIARGGTGTTSFTGTGNNVFSASPTFTGTIGAAALTATGTVTASTFNATSDSNFKTDIKDLPVDYSINLLNKLNPKSYRLLNDSNNIRFGFIAQEVQHILDEPLGLHCINENSTQSICYQELIAPLVSVTHSLLARNEELTKRVCDLEQLVNSLK